jgi:hypothetical protein
MTIDDRLVKLTHRHEALTKFLGLIARMQRDLAAMVKQDAENIRALAHIAEIHERRLTEVEGGE